MTTESEKLANTPPAKRGWYWVQTNPAWGNAPEVVFIGFPEYDDRLHVYSIGEGIEILEEYCRRYPRRWLGEASTPVPEPPTESE
jgi:hypothetical protein